MSALLRSHARRTAWLSFLADEPALTNGRSLRDAEGATRLCRRRMQATNILSRRVDSKIAVALRQSVR